MIVKDYLKGVAPENYHIFDSHQEMMSDLGANHGDQDYKVYTYNQHVNNRPKPGDVFLYRRPGRSAKPRGKFIIYGGGVVKDIEPINDLGDVRIIIEKPFKLLNPLVQGDPALEDFEWTSKTRNKDKSWGHFWYQYGMNVINEHDFMGLVGDLECIIPENLDSSSIDTEELTEENKRSTLADLSGFELNIKTGKLTNKHVVTRKMDYSLLQDKKQTIGKAGEYLVIDLLKDEYSDEGVTIEHTSEEIGDGCGYDIKVTFPDGFEKMIEVKTTSSNTKDGFYLTPAELRSSINCANSKKRKYIIYRLYNYKEYSKKADVEKYEAPFTKDMYRFETVSWKVFVK